MRINGLNQIKSNYLKNKSKVSTDVQKQDKNETAAQGNDKVEISTSAMQTRNIALETNKFNLRIDDLKTAIENGKYTINTDKIARLLIEK